MEEIISHLFPVNVKRKNFIFPIRCLRVRKLFIGEVFRKLFGKVIVRKRCRIQRIRAICKRSQLILGSRLISRTRQQHIKVGVGVGFRIQFRIVREDLLANLLISPLVDHAPMLLLLLYAFAIIAFADKPHIRRVVEHIVDIFVLSEHFHAAHIAAAEFLQFLFRDCRDTENEAGPFVFFAQRLCRFHGSILIDSEDRVLIHSIFHGYKIADRFRNLKLDSLFVNCRFSGHCGECAKRCDGCCKYGTCHPFLNHFDSSL